MYKASLKSSLTPCIRSEHASFTNAKRHSVLFEQQVQFNKASVDAAETAERRYSFILSSLVAGDSGVQCPRERQRFVSRFGGFKRSKVEM